MTITAEQLAAVKNTKPRSRPAVAKKNKKVTAKPIRAKKKTTKATIRIDRAMFCKELIKNSMNSTEAYLAVCPKVKRTTAAANGHKLLRETEVIDILSPLLQELFIDAGIEAEYVFKRWLEIAEGSAADYFNFEGGTPRLDMSDMSPAQRANLKSITISHTQHGTNYKIETYDAQKAIDTVGKHLGLLVDKLDDQSIDKIGSLIEDGVARIKASKDLDGWRSMIVNGQVIGEQ